MVAIIAHARTLLQGNNFERGRALSRQRVFPRPVQLTIICAAYGALRLRRASLLLRWDGALGRQKPEHRNDPDERERECGPDPGHGDGCGIKRNRRDLLAPTCVRGPNTLAAYLTPERHIAEPRNSADRGVERGGNDDRLGLSPRVYGLGFLSAAAGFGAAPVLGFQYPGSALMNASGT